MASFSDDEFEYLSPSFDPASLTIPRLRAILVAHDIPYTASAKKPQLIEIFNQQLVPKSRKILAARSRTKRTSRGITDMPSSQEGTVNGDTEENGLMPPPPVPDTPRRKKSARASTEDSADEVLKTRKAIGARKSAVKHPRASDSEAGPDIEPPLVRRSRKSEVTPTVKVEEPEETQSRPGLPGSVFSHDNPFQSGSSPLGPSENRRKSAGTSADRRKSSSRRRTMAEASTSDRAVTRHDAGTKVPSSRTFEVPLTRLKDRKLKQEPEQEQDREDIVEPGEEFTMEEQLELVRDRAAKGEVDILPPRRIKRVKRASGVSKSAPWIVLLTILTGYAAWWRKEKIEMGYCGIGKASSTVASMELPQWASVLQPQCELCPQHAYCYADMETRCESDYVFKPHPLSLGGLVPLPPSCEPDGEKVRKVKAVADRAIEQLRERRAQWECGTLTESDGKEATSVEIDQAMLKTEVSHRRRKGMSEAEFEDLWIGALGEIMGRDEVASDTDGNENPHALSSNSLARLPFVCALRRSARLTLARYRIQLLTLLITFLAAMYSYNRLVTSRSDTARVPQLVSTTLDRLATQAALYAHGNSPEAFISVGQMRDDVLRDEFSTKRREAIWRRVGGVVGTNANVRTSVKEGRAGDYSQVWEWIGSIKALEDAWGSGGRRESGRYSLGPIVGDEQRGSLAVDNGGDGSAVRKWDEGRPIY